MRGGCTRMGIAMYMCDARVTPVPQAVPVRMIKRIQLTGKPALMVYRAPTAHELALCRTTRITCRFCDSEWALGTWLCLKCWEPFSFAALNDSQSHIVDQPSRRKGLWDRYHLTIHDFEQLRQQYGTALT